MSVTCSTKKSEDDGMSRTSTSGGDSGGTKRGLPAEPTTIAKRYKERPSIIQDRLGMCVNKFSRFMEQASTWAEFVSLARGEALFSEKLDSLPHPAREMLVEMRDEGVPVQLMGPKWTKADREKVVAKGTSKTAQEHAEFVRGEFADFGEQGFWAVLRYKDIEAAQFPDLDLGDFRLSSCFCVEQKERRPRFITNLSSGVVSVNDDTIAYAPEETMQFGGTFNRIGYRVRHANPKFGPVNIDKNDVANGYCRVIMAAKTLLGAAVLLPEYEGEDQLVGIPLSLTMGWTESPRAFCAVTETITDIANQQMHRRYAPPHRLEKVLEKGDVAAAIVATNLRAAKLSQRAATSRSCLPSVDPPVGQAGPVEGTTVCDASASPSVASASPISPTTGDDVSTSRLAAPAAPSITTGRSTSERTGHEKMVATTVEPKFQDIGSSSGNDRSIVLLPECAPAPQHHTSQPFAEPLNYRDVFVDDFIGVAQGSKRRLRTISRLLWHIVDGVWKPPDANDSTREEPISVKKLLKGDGSWSTIKEVLGWIIDTVDKTITLPPRRATRLLDIFDELRGKRRIGVKLWHKFLGELRSMVLAIPGGRGLFSALQLGLKHADKHRIRVTPHLRNYLNDFETLAHSLVNRPTRLAEIFPDEPVVVGACDAAKPGMGGVIFTAEHPPIVWRAPFPLDIQQEVVTDKNLSGKITNSDLEQAGVLAHQDVICQNFDVRECTLATGCDNTPAVSRNRKGSVTNADSAAYLCRLSSFHQRQHRYCPEVSYLGGPSNVMADDASRLWDRSDSQLLSHFNQTYPQEQPWRLCPLRPEMLSALISALHTKPVELASFLAEWQPEILPGLCGKNFAHPLTPTPYSLPAQSKNPNRNPLHCYRFLPNAIETEDLRKTKATTPYEVARWRTPYVISARRSPVWGYPTRVSSPQDVSDLLSRTRSQVIRKKTGLLDASGPSPLPSSVRSWKWHKRAPLPSANLPLPTSSSSPSSFSVAPANMSHSRKKLAVPHSVCATLPSTPALNVSPTLHL